MRKLYTQLQKLSFCLHHHHHHHHHRTNSPLLTLCASGCCVFTSTAKWLPGGFLSWFIKLKSSCPTVTESATSESWERLRVCSSIIKPLISVWNRYLIWTCKQRMDDVVSCLTWDNSQFVWAVFISGDSLRLLHQHHPKTLNEKQRKERLWV